MDDFPDLRPPAHLLRNNDNSEPENDTNVETPTNTERKMELMRKQRIHTWRIWKMEIMRKQKIFHREKVRKIREKTNYK